MHQSLTLGYKAFKQETELIYKLEICTTLGNKLILLDVANGKFHKFVNFSSTEILIMQLIAQDLLHFGEILINFMPCPIQIITKLI